MQVAPYPGIWNGEPAAAGHLAAGLDEPGALIAGHHHAAGELLRAGGLERLHARIDAAGGGRAVEQRIESILPRLQLPPDVVASTLVRATGW